MKASYINKMLKWIKLLCLIHFFVFTFLLRHQAYMQQQESSSYVSAQMKCMNSIQVREAPKKAQYLAQMFHVLRHTPLLPIAFIAELI